MGRRSLRILVFMLILMITAGCKAAPDQVDSLPPATKHLLKAGSTPEDDLPASIEHIETTARNLLAKANFRTAIAGGQIRPEGNRNVFGHPSFTDSRFRTNNQRLPCTRARHFDMSLDVETAIRNTLTAERPDLPLSTADLLVLSGKGKSFVSKRQPALEALIAKINSADSKENEEETAGSYIMRVFYDCFVAVVYEVDSNGYEIPVRTMIIGPGTDTNDYIWGNSFRLTPAGEWISFSAWNPPVPVRYVTSISGDYFFHSVAYYTYGDPSSMKTWQYDALGGPVSAGCIRMTVADARWVYYNAYAISSCHFHVSSDGYEIGYYYYPPQNYDGWDPTDPEYGGYVGPAIPDYEDEEPELTDPPAEDIEPPAEDTDPPPETTESASGETAQEAETTEPSAEETTDPEPPAEETTDPEQSTEPQSTSGADVAG
jgi:hypothetical protein